MPDETKTQPFDPVDTTALDYKEPQTSLPRDPQLDDMWGKLPYMRWRNVGRIIELKIIDDTTVLTTGDGKLSFCIPASLDGAVVQQVAAFVSTVSASGGPILVQLRNVTDSVDILSTMINIDDSEKTSYTAATAAVVNPANKILQKGDLIAVDIDDAGDGAAKGLGVILELQ